MSESSFEPGFPLFIKGTVIRGRGQGKAILGFPTANLLADDHLDSVARLGLGVFGGFATVENEKVIHRMVCSVGKNETMVQGGPLTIEVHVLHNFEGDFYDRTISVFFWCKLREQRTFSGLEELKAAIRADIDNCYSRLAGSLSIPVGISLEEWARSMHALGF